MPAQVPLPDDLLKDLTFVSNTDSIQERMRQLVLYISDKCRGDAGFGKVKLNKILYFSDFLSFERTGSPITGSAYEKQDRGPMAVALREVTPGMIDRREFAYQEVKYYGYPQQRPVNLQGADLSMFTSEDIAIVDQVIQSLWELNGRDVSEKSHGIAWRAAAQGGRIPYEAAYVSDDGLTPADEDRGRELLAKFGWNV